MKCVICKVEETCPGRTLVTLERESTTLVFKAVPAEVCDNLSRHSPRAPSAGRPSKSKESAFGRLGGPPVAKSMWADGMPQPMEKA
jgi:hypothetical protein